MSRELTHLSLAHLELGDTIQARQRLLEALQIAHEIQFRSTSLCSLAATALLLTVSRQPARAVELYALASRYPFVANSRWFEDMVGCKIAAAGVALPPDVVEAAQEWGRARDLDETVAELLAEFQALGPD